MRTTLATPIIGLLFYAACGQPPPTVNTNTSAVSNKNQPPPSQSSASVQNVESTAAAQDKATENKMVNKKEMLAEAGAVLQDIKSMESEGRNILRGTQSAHDECMNKIKTRWQRVQTLRKTVERLPQALQLYLGPASAELINCVSCGSDAVSYCDQTKYWIKEAEKEITEYAR